MSASPGRRRADLSPRPYRLLRDDIAPKLSARPGAAVAFLLLADPPEAPAPDLFVAVTANKVIGDRPRLVGRLRESRRRRLSARLLS